MLSWDVVGSEAVLKASRRVVWQPVVGMALYDSMCGQSAQRISNTIIYCRRFMFRHRSLSSSTILIPIT